MSVRTYYGHHIYPVTRRTAIGARWETYAGGRFVMADTLNGIKAAIREEIGR